MFYNQREVHERVLNVTNIPEGANVFLGECQLEGPAETLAIYKDVRGGSLSISYYQDPQAHTILRVRKARTMLPFQTTIPFVKDQSSSNVNTIVTADII